MKRLAAIIALAATTLATTTALAHVTLEQREAIVGMPYKALFRVPHGCDGSATIKLTVRIPEGIIAVKPMAKPGWQIALKRSAYAKEHSYLHGAKFSEGVTEVTWSGGRLPNDLFDDFILSVFIAGDLQAGTTLYFPVVQDCEQGSHHWVGLPAADKPDDAEPAPGLKLIPKP